MNFYHGSDSELQVHIGLCLTQDELAAANYGEIVTKVSIDLNGLVVRNVDHLVDRDNMNYPGDNAKSIASLQADGIDVIEFTDEDERGRSHDTYRLVSQKAVDAVIIK